MIGLIFLKKVKNIIIEKKNATTHEIADLNLVIERNQTSIERLNYELKDLEDKKKKYEELSEDEKKGAFHVRAIDGIGE